MQSRLSGLSVLITRPREQADSLARALQAADARPLCIAMTETRARAPLNRACLDGATAAIFISRNAVRFAFEQGPFEVQQFKGIQCFAVGPGTAQELQEKTGIGATVPLSHYNSEGLLELAELQAIAKGGGKVVIFRGTGGRELLAERLRERGAALEYCEVYERHESRHSLAQALAGAAQIPAIAVVSSRAVLAHFAAKIAAEGLTSLYELPLVVYGARIANDVASYGFTKAPLIVDNPTDEDVIETLSQWVMEKL